MQTARLSVAYLEQGDADGLPAIFLHGSHGSRNWWQPLFELLPSEIHAVAPDLRGHGLSEKAANGYSIDELAADLHSFAGAIALPNFDLVAHSSGAAIAVEFALAYPAAVNTLSLIAPPSLEGVHTPSDTYELLEKMRQDRALHQRAIELMLPTFAGSATARDALLSALVADAQAMAPAAFTEVAHALGRWNRFKDAQQLTLPTLLLWGDRDEIVSRDAVTRALIAIPGAANLEILRGVGHSPMIEAPLITAEKIVDFITEDYSGFSAIRASAEDEAP